MKVNNFDELSAIAVEALAAVWEQKKHKIINRRKRSEAFLKTLTEHDTVIEEFDEGLFAATVVN